MKNKKIIRAADYLPEARSGPADGRDFALPTPDGLLLGLFGTTPDYSNPKFESLWQQIVDAEDEPTIAYCLARGVDVTGGDGEPVRGWRDVAVMLQALERGWLRLNESEEPPHEDH